MNKLIDDYILSEEGEDFLEVFIERFESHFSYQIPDGDSLVYRAQKGSFSIPENETVENLKSTVTESLKQNKDLLRERYKEYEMIFDEDCEY